MKKVGKLTEASMVHPEQPKFYPLVTDGLFEAKVKVKPKSGKKVLEDDLPMNNPADPDLSNTNSPRRATKASVQVGGPFDLTDAKDKDWIGDAEEDIERRGTKGKCTPITKKGCTGKAKALAKTFKKMAKRKKNEAQESGAYAEKIKKQSDDHRATNPIKKPGLQPGQTSIGDPSHPDHKPAPSNDGKPAYSNDEKPKVESGRPLKKGTAKRVAK